MAKTSKRNPARENMKHPQKKKKVSDVDIRKRADQIYQERKDENDSAKSDWLQEEDEFLFNSEF